MVKAVLAMNIIYWELIMLSGVSALVIFSIQCTANVTRSALLWPLLFVAKSSHPGWIEVSRRRERFSRY